MTENLPVNFENRSSDDARAWARHELLRAAEEGKTIRHQLMIGDTLVNNGLTFEEVRDELYKLLDEGLIQLDSSYRPLLTEGGVNELEQ